MTLEELTVEVAELKKAVARLEHQAQSERKNASMMSAMGILRDFPDFGEVIAFGRYFRVTGQLPPRDWNPGDPIPTEETP